MQTNFECSACFFLPVPSPEVWNYFVYAIVLSKGVNILLLVEVRDLLSEKGYKYGKVEFKEKSYIPMNTRV